MIIKLYKNTSESIRVNKSNYLLELATFEGTLREECSVNNPIILLEINDNTLGNGYFPIVDDDNNEVIDDNANQVVYQRNLNIFDCNYVYIPDFKRYYFIDNITSIRQNIWSISLKVDVLMSNKDKLLNLYGFINRNEFTYNEYIKDDLVSYYYDKDVTEYALPKGFRVNTTFDPSSSQFVRRNRFLLTYIGVGTTTGQSVVPPLEQYPSALPVVSNTTSGQGITYNTAIMDADSLANLCWDILEDDTLLSYIISIVAYPFEIPYIEEYGDYLKLGNTTLEHTYIYPLQHNLSEYFVIADFKIDSTSFLDYEPYTQYQLWIPYLSWVTIQADDILNSQLMVYYVIDYQSGNAQVTIYDTIKNKNIYTSACQLGSKLGLSTTNAREVNDRETSNNISLGVGLISSALSITGGAITGNPISMGMGVLSGGSTIANYIQNQNTNYNRASGSVSTSNSGFYLPQDVRLRKIKLKPRNYDSNYFKLKGRPLNEYRLLSDLSGFTIVGDIHLENLDSITSSEMDELYNLLTTGVIL